MKMHNLFITTLVLLSINAFGQGIPSMIELKQYEPTEKQIISGSHGDAEIVLGWWGWYGMTPHVAKVLEECAEKAIAEPKKYKYTFEYDAASWQFYDKFYPEVIQKVRRAIQAGAWEVTGGTYSIHLPYMLGIESNIRQWVMGQNSLHEILGTKASVFHYQEFLLFPQLPMFLKNVGIENSFYENHLAICGSLDKDWRGVKWWEASDGSTVKAVSEYPGLEVGWPDLLHIKSTETLMSKFFDQLPDPKDTINPGEDQFYFDAADLGDSYGNMVSVLCYKTEYELLVAERLSTIAYMLGGEDYSDMLTTAWGGLLSMQSHGIIYCASECYCVETGASLWESGKYNLDVARQIARQVTDKSLKYISHDFKSDRYGNAKPFIIFNPLAHDNTPFISKEFFFEKGEMKNICLKDVNGELPFSIKKMARYQDGSIQDAEIIFNPKLPPMGVQMLYLCDEEAQGKIRSALNLKDNILENENIRIDYNNRGIVAIYSKKQDRIILGRDVSMESNDRYDKTLAINLRNTFKINDDFKYKGIDVVANDDMHIALAFNYETKLATHRIIATLYKGSEFVDITLEHKSKSESGELMAMPYGEYKERMWLDFHPAFKGEVKCNTIADVQNEERDYYYSNTWLNMNGKDAGFSLFHKGIHAYEKGYVTQECREKREFAISAQLGCTVNEWVPGMVVMNSQFGEDGILRQEFRLDLNKDTDEYRLEKKSREFIFNCPLSLVMKNSKGESEKSYLNITSENAFVSAFYANATTGKKPVLRLFNPLNTPQLVRYDHAFGNIKLQPVRFDGKATAEPTKDHGEVALKSRSINSFLLSDYKTVQSKPEKGIMFSNVPFTEKNDEYYFDAPMESYRFIKQYVMYNDGNSNVSMLSDMYEDFPVTLEEKEKVGDYRIFEAEVMIPENMKGRDMRLVTLWNTTKQYGVGTCILTDDYTQRADEPITLWVNNKLVKNFNFNISDQVKFGTKNKFQLRVLAAEPKDEVLLQRSSVKQYLSNSFEENKRVNRVINAGFFEEIKKSVLRVGKRYNVRSIANEKYCTIVNPDFSTGTTRGWKVTGNVEVTNNDKGKYSNWFALISDHGNLQQQISLTPGNYFIKINSKSVQAQGEIKIEMQDGTRYSEQLPSENQWLTSSLFISVPKNEKISVILKNEKGKLFVDELIIIKNVTNQTP